MNYLKAYVTEDTLKLFSEYNSPMLVTDMIANKDNVIRVISYLQEVGIKVIDKLLVEKPDLFFLDVSEIKKHLSNYDIKQIVRMINDDISNFDLV